MGAGRCWGADLERIVDQVGVAGASESGKREMERDNQSEDQEGEEEEEEQEEKRVEKEGGSR